MRGLRFEGGNASVEFIGVTAALLVPLFYLVLAAAQLQCASLGGAHASREAGRVFAASLPASGEAEARRRAALAAELAWQDQGLDLRADGATLVIVCERTPCATAGGRVIVTTRTSVSPPLLPDGALGTLTVSAQHVVRVDQFAQLEDAGQDTAPEAVP